MTDLADLFKIQPTAYTYFTACGGYSEVFLWNVPLHFLVNQFRHSKETSLFSEYEQSRLYKASLLNKSNVGKWQLFMQQPSGPEGMFDLAL